MEQLLLAFNQVKLIQLIIWLLVVVVIAYTINGGNSG